MRPSSSAHRLALPREDAPSPPRQPDVTGGYSWPCAPALFKGTQHIPTWTIPAGKLRADLEEARSECTHVSDTCTHRHTRAHTDTHAPPSWTQTNPRYFTSDRASSRGAPHQSHGGLGAAPAHQGGGATQRPGFAGWHPGTSSTRHPNTGAPSLRWAWRRNREGGVGAGGEQGRQLLAP